jgi:hypothetical protein
MERDASFWEIFKNLNSHEDWESYISYTKLRNDLDEGTRSQLVEAYSFLRNEFQSYFLKNARNDHVVYQEITGKKDKTVLWLHAVLQDFKKTTTSNYNILLSYLKTSKYIKNLGIPFLEIGNALKSAGFEVVFEPGNGKGPDIKFTNSHTGEICYAEISLVEESAKRKESTDIYNALLNIFQFSLPRTLFACEILNTCDKDKIAELLQKIQDIKNQAIEENRIIELTREETEGILKVLIGPFNQQIAFQHECDSKNMINGDLRSLPLDFNESPRIRNNKLKEKARQLSTEFSGVIFLKVSPLYFIARHPIIIIEDLQTKLAEYPHVLGVVIYSKVGNTIGEECFTYKLSSYSKYETILDETYSVLFIFNHKCTKQITLNTLGMLNDSFSKFV